MANPLFATKPLSLMLEELKGENRLRRVLGPLQAIRDGEVVPIGGPNVRLTLALLLVSAGWLDRNDSTA